MSAPALASPLTSPAEVHHAVPRCLLRLHAEATSGGLDGAGIQAWLEWEALCWGVPVEIERADLERLVEDSAVLLEREKHRLIHGSDWQRWGRRGASPRSGATGRVGTVPSPSSGGAGSTRRTWTAPAWWAEASRSRTT
jgi:hypothetical protein